MLWQRLWKGALVVGVVACVVHGVAILQLVNQTASGRLRLAWDMGRLTDRLAMPWAQLEWLMYAPWLMPSMYPLTIAATLIAARRVADRRLLTFDVVLIIIGAIGPAVKLTAAVTYLALHFNGGWLYVNFGVREFIEQCTYVLMYAAPMAPMLLLLVIDRVGGGARPKAGIAADGRV